MTWKGAPWLAICWSCFYCYLWTQCVRNIFIIQTVPHLDWHLRAVIQFQHDPADSPTKLREEIESQFE